jgi:hypothetical protein
MENNTNPTNTLSATPLHDWMGEDLLAEAKRAARFWASNPAFNPKNGGTFSSQDDLSAEIVCRVIERLKKEPPNNAIDQVAFFHRVARYCQPGIIQSNYSLPSLTEGVASDSEDFGCDDVVDPSFCDEADESDQEKSEAILRLFKKIGISEHDSSIFETTSSDFEEATGLSERHLRDKKAARKKEIVRVIKAKNLGDDLSRLLPGLRDAIFA